MPLPACGNGRRRRWRKPPKETPPAGGVPIERHGVQWKNKYSSTSTMPGTPRIQARKYLPMNALLVDVLKVGDAIICQDERGFRTLLHKSKLKFS
jgi:hypothetical protein